MIIEALADQLRDYQPWHAARAAILAATGASREAAIAYRCAIESAPTPAEVLFLKRRLAELGEVKTEPATQ